MPTNGNVGYGIVLSRFNGTSYVPLSELLEIDGVTINVEMIEATHHASPNNAAEYIGGKITVDPITLTLNWVPSAVDVLRSDAVSRLKTSWRFTLSNNTSYTFEANVMTWRAATPREDKMTLEVMLQPSGVGTWA